MTADGEHLQVRSFGGAEDDGVMGLKVLPTGEVFVRGWFQGAFGAGHDAHAAVDSHDAYLMAFSSGGDLAWSYASGRAGEQWLQAMAVDRQGRMVVGLNGDAADIVLLRLTP